MHFDFCFFFLQKCYATSSCLNVSLSLHLLPFFQCIKSLLALFGIYVPTTWKIDARDGKMVRQTFDSRGQTFDSEGESCFSERSEAKHSPEESKVCPRESKVPNHFSIPGKFNFSCSRIHFLAC